MKIIQHFWDGLRFSLKSCKLCYPLLPTSEQQVAKSYVSRGKDVFQIQISRNPYRTSQSVVNFLAPVVMMKKQEEKNEETVVTLCQSRTWLFFFIKLSFE